MGSDEECKELTFKVGERQTVAFDLSSIDPELGDYDIDLETEIEYSLVVVNSSSGEVLFSKDDVDFDIKTTEEEAWVQFDESDLSETGSFDVEFMVTIDDDTTDDIDWIEKSKNFKMYIQESLH